MIINTIIIDIETLDTEPTAVILSVGAFAFNRFKTEKTIDTIKNYHNLSGNEYIYFVCDITDQLMNDKRTISQDTIDWWNEQSCEAKKFLGVNPNKYFLNRALNDLLNWYLSLLKENLIDKDNFNFYFRGTDFDPVILKNAFESYDLKTPWKFNQVRDVRTYIDALMGSNKGYIENHKPCFEMVKHHALHDAMNDAEPMCLAYEMSKTK